MTAWHRGKDLRYATKRDEIVRIVSETKLGVTSRKVGRRIILYAEWVLGKLNRACNIREY